MKIRRAHIILVDISGYTRFIRLHRMSMIHAELIITELLESVIAAAALPLMLNKLEGDAALFYALIDEAPQGAGAVAETAGADSLLSQLLGFFEAFRLRERALVSECTICYCDACTRAGELRLKVVAHTGTLIVKKVRQFEEIAGEDVILIHRLLKNSVPGDEYLLLTDAFHALSGWTDPKPLEPRVEKIGDDSSPIQVLVHYPSDRPASPPPLHASFWKRVKTTLRMESHTVRRLFSKPTRTFRHLSEQDGPDPPDY